MLLSNWNLIVLVMSTISCSISLSMTKEFLQKHCKDNKLYRTPELNDVLYLHYKGILSLSSQFIIFLKASRQTANLINFRVAFQIFYYYFCDDILTIKLIIYLYIFYLCLFFQDFPKLKTLRSTQD